MLNQSKEALCIRVSFQESQNLIKEEPFMTCFYHIGGHFKAV